MDFILEDAYKGAYLPFFEVLKDFRDIKINLHFSGFLFSWLCEKKPELHHFTEIIKETKVRLKLFPVVCMNLYFHSFQRMMVAVRSRCILI